MKQNIICLKYTNYCLEMCWKKVFRACPTVHGSCNAPIWPPEGTPPVYSSVSRCGLHFPWSLASTCLQATSRASEKEIDDLSASPRPISDFYWQQSRHFLCRRQNLHGLNLRGKIYHIDLRKNDINVDFTVALC